MISVKWYGTNALEFKYSNGTFMIDPYVSRNPGQLTVPQEQKKASSTILDISYSSFALEISGN